MSSTADGDFNSPYGVIHCRYPGPFNDPPYGNVEVYQQTATRTVILQRAALRAFKAAEARCVTAKRKHILITGHGYRSYAQQKLLVDKCKADPNCPDGRFADPDKSMHVEADAIDVDQDLQSDFRLKQIHKALLAEGWFQAVEGEPWHYSFRVPG